MLLGPDLDRLIDEEHRNAVLDAVRLVQAGVVQDLVNEYQRTTVGRAHQDFHQLVVEHGYGLAGWPITGAVLPPMVGAPSLGI